MSYRPTKAEQARVRSYVRKWLPELLLNAHSITIEFSMRKCRTSPMAAATCTTKTPYLDVALAIFPLFWEQDEIERERIVIHELCHIITQASKEAACSLHNGSFVTWREIEAANETLTDHLTNVLWRRR